MTQYVRTDQVDQFQMVEAEQFDGSPAMIRRFHMYQQLPDPYSNRRVDDWYWDVQVDAAVSYTVWLRVGDWIINHGEMVFSDGIFQETFRPFSERKEANK
jgi:hypothetical protein